MKNLNFICVVFSLMCVSTTSIAFDSSNRHMKYGPTCGTYVTWYQESNFVGIKGYVAGYLTAYNNFVDNGVSNILTDQRSFDDVVLWVNSWCRNNPLEDFAGGMKALIIELCLKDFDISKPKCLGWES